MFEKYFLVELFGTNGVKSSRSNGVLTTKKRFPPIEVAYENMIKAGFTSVNVLSVTRINKKTADYIKSHINQRVQNNNSSTQETLDKLLKATEDSIKGINETV